MCVVSNLSVLTCSKRPLNVLDPTSLSRIIVFYRKYNFFFNVSFLYRKKIGLNFLLRNHFCFTVLRPGTEPCDYEAVSRNLPPIIFCARFEFTWFRKSPNFNKI